MEFSDKMKLVREKLAISQEKMAQALGVSFATINRLESGRSFPSYKTLKNFEKFCFDKKDNLGKVYEEIL